MSLVMVLGLEARVLSPMARIALTTGVLVRLIQDGAWKHALLNVSITLAGGLIAGFGGMAVGHWWVPRN